MPESLESQPCVNWHATQGAVASIPPHRRPLQSPQRAEQVASFNPRRGENGYHKRRQKFAGIQLYLLTRKT
jgi:hypothetical protein